VSNIQKRHEYATDILPEQSLLYVAINTGIPNPVASISSIAPLKISLTAVNNGGDINIIRELTSTISRRVVKQSGHARLAAIGIFILISLF
jgi:hypothetical protein